MEIPKEFLSKEFLSQFMSQGDVEVFLPSFTSKFTRVRFKVRRMFIWAMRKRAKEGI